MSGSAVGLVGSGAGSRQQNRPADFWNVAARLPPDNGHACARSTSCKTWGERIVLRRNMFGLAVAVLLALPTVATSAGLEAGTPGNAALPSTGDPMPPRGVAVARNSSCVSDCQTQHDRCRVVTKGSRTCDEERQRCLEICLQKKKK
jgi:hypothetical protein